MVLEDETIIFVQQYVFINLATRDVINMPMLARAYGCRVDENRNSITLFINPEHNQKLLENKVSSRVHFFSNA